VPKKKTLTDLALPLHVVDELLKKWSYIRQLITIRKYNKSLLYPVLIKLGITTLQLPSLDKGKGKGVDLVSFTKIFNLQRLP
jgi:hypothetical protein